MTTSEMKPISLSERAAEHLKAQIDEKRIPEEHGLRVGVDEGCCNGHTYVVGFGAARDGDKIFEDKGVRIFMEKADIIYLLGMQIDYGASADNQGFEFINPNAEDTCGCGASFSIK